MYFLKENCQIEHSGVTFCIPKDYYFNPEEPHYFCCMPRGKGFKVYYELCYEEIRAKQSIKNYQQETDETSAPIKKIEHNGLKGYCSTFSDVEDEVFMAVFSIVDRAEGYNRFKFSVSTPSFDFEEIKASPAFQKLWDGIGKTTRKQKQITNRES